MKKIYYGKSKIDIMAETIYALITSDELDRDEAIATIKLNLELSSKMKKEKYKRTEEHNRHISEGMKETWKSWRKEKINIGNYKKDV